MRNPSIPPHPDPGLSRTRVTNAEQSWAPSATASAAASSARVRVSLERVDAATGSARRPADVDAATAAAATAAAVAADIFVAAPRAAPDAVEFFTVVDGRGGPAVARGDAFPTAHADE